MDPTAPETPTPEGEDKSSVQTGAPERTSAETTSTPDYFGDKFDPSTLPDELQAGWKSLQGDYTRKMQELSEQRQQAESVQAAFTDLRSEDPEISQHALQWLTQTGLLTEDAVSRLLPAFGYQFEDDTTDDETPDDPVARLQARLDNLEGSLTQKERQEAEEAYISQVDQHLGSELERINATLKEQGRSELSERQRQRIVKDALYDAEPGTLPDVQAAFDGYVSELDESLKGWAQTKQGGATRPGGSAATQVPDLDNQRDRQDYMAERLQALADNV